jgi:hypothetical protein
MQESLLQYIWKNSLFQQHKYNADTGESVDIIDPGVHNSDGGPDFTNARVEIDGTTWAGNIEIHIPAYNNVILHVFTHTDRECFNSMGRQVPGIELQFDRGIEKRYRELIASRANIPCHNSLYKLNRALISFWLSALTIERLRLKISAIKELLEFTRNSWEEAFYIYVAHSFGLKINTLPFELVAKSIPLKILALHAKNQKQLEALLFGQAGFLEEVPRDEYQGNLKKEYLYLQAKYKLKPIKKHLWKFLRLRPKNFPTIRLAQFASLINRSKHLFSRTIECEEPGQLVRIYNCHVSEYWKNHYTFGKISEYSEKVLGKSTINSIIINTIIPFMFIFGEHKDNEAIKEKAILLLEKIPSEKNNITRTWASHAIHCRSAAESQALIELTTGYCHYKRCIDCQIGHLILKGTN